MDAKGKQIRKTRTFHGSKTDAKKALTNFQAEVDRTYLSSGSKHTFSEFTERWLAIHAEPNLAPKTVVDYKKQLTNHILPALGDIKLERLRAVHIQDFYSRLQEEGARLDGKSGGLSPITIKQFHRIISSILNSAVEWGTLTDNIAKNAKPPKATQNETDSYDEKMALKLLESLEGEPTKYRALINVALFVGLRRGECLGLEWSDIDFEHYTLTVKRQSQYLPGKGVIPSNPKTKGSRRTVAVPSSLIKLLKELRSEQLQERLHLGGLWEDNNRLFTTWNGKPMHPDTISSWFADFLSRKELPHIKFHALRHTSASLMIASGVDIKAVSKRLGHAQTSTTANIYAHAFQSADRSASDKMETLLYKTKLENLQSKEKGLK